MSEYLRLKFKRVYRPQDCDKDVIKVLGTSIKRQKGTISNYIFNLNIFANI